jgi:DNA modification methylase
LGTARRRVVRQVEREDVAKAEFINEIVLDDCLDLLPRVPGDSVRTIHTSPPYNIARGYEGYHDNLTDKDYLGFIERVLAECRRVLVPGGALFWQTRSTSRLWIT